MPEDTRPGFVWFRNDELTLLKTDDFLRVQTDQFNYFKTDEFLRFQGEKFEFIIELPRGPNDPQRTALLEQDSPQDAIDEVEAVYHVEDFGLL